jgi:penicillin-binding protein 2
VAGTIQQRQTGLRQQPLVLLLVVLLFCGAMVSRLVWMQLLEGARYRELADENRIRLVPRSPIRGRLLDRKGRVLATSRLSYSLYLEPRLVGNEDWPDLRDRLARLLNLDPVQLDRERQRGPGRDGFRTTLALDLRPEQVLRFREQALGLKGAQVDVDILRFYPHGTLAAHALGYTQPITEAEYETLSERGYRIRDRIGRTGVEAAYESHLRGKWGGQMLEVNAMGEVQRNLGDRPSVAGKDLTLTLDLDLQRAAETALADKPGGAVVALDPKDGAILALASKPGFDPNFFSKLITTQKEYDALFSNPKKPLLSRAMNPYDPGSTWKPVTAMAGMESGKFPPETKLHTTACITYGGHCFPDHNGVGFGHIGYADALRHSSNTFFYQVGVGAGSKALKQAADQLGFQQKTGIEIGWEESVGLVGDEAWAAAGRGWAEPGTVPWIPEDMASASIGQSAAAGPCLRRVCQRWLVGDTASGPGHHRLAGCRSPPQGGDEALHPGHDPRRLAQGGVSGNGVWTQRTGHPSGGWQDRHGGGQHRWAGPCLVQLLCPVPQRGDRCGGVRSKHPRRWIGACPADGQGGAGGMEQNPPGLTVRRLR